MKILFAGDEHPYSAYALNEVVRLATNTWADVTLLAVTPAEAAARDVEDQPLAQALHRYREDFLASAGGEGSPYAMGPSRYEWVSLRGGQWEELLVSRGAKKDVKVCLRRGNEAQEILAEARDEESDLIVLGCTKGGQCIWQGSAPVPQKVVNDADCSVLLVKEEQPISRILACLDQSYISQDSLEMINQMATLHQAQLELIGLSQEGGMKKDVYRRLIEIGDYYEDRQIKVSTRLTEIVDFENLLDKELQQDLLALFMGKKSLLDRFFPKDWAGRFVSKCQTSVLVMR
ncbi:MAG: universal stress protein [Deltaproteobacteria bacterium]|jgi:nucleotide-binding universal stress UspA family protein